MASLPVPSSFSATSHVSTHSMKSKRELAHDLSNALEIIMQTSFLMGTLELGENGRAWHKLLDDGVQRAVAINKQLRDSLRSDSEL
ncbi:hypothetical protein [Acidisarcina polymorpha]|nr:hypothetical protein [Acidisarcina polymorpha]